MTIEEIERLDKDDHRYFLAPNTWYHVFKIVDMCGEEFIDFDTTINADNIFTPYMECKRVCTCFTDDIGNIVPFVQCGDTFRIYWKEGHFV